MTFGRIFHDPPFFFFHGYGIIEIMTELEDTLQELDVKLRNIADRL